MQTMKKIIIKILGAIKKRLLFFIWRDYMKKFLINEKRNKKRLSAMLRSIVMTAVMTVSAGISYCYAASGADAINTAKSLLSKGATAGGGLWAVWGLVQLGIGIKDHNGPGIQGAIWQIIGGAIIIAAGAAVAALDLSITA